MDFDTQNSASAAMMATRTTIATTVEAKATTTEVIEDKKRVIDEIREKGFSAFLEDLKEEQMKKLREEILRSMGLTEDDLEKMPGEQRAQIEKLIQQEIQERMAAKSEMNGENGTTVTAVQTLEVRVSQAVTSSMIMRGTGLGPLLALQEADAANDPANALLGEKKDLENG